MPLYSFEGRRPRVDREAFVAPTATLVGDVTVEAKGPRRRPRGEAGRPPRAR